MFIVFESIDGGGKGFQRIEIMDKLSKRGIQVSGEEFPVHNAFYETVIHPALQEQVKMNKSSWVLSYLLDKTLNSDKIVPFIGDTKSIYIADGYFTTTIAYQSLLMQQVPLKKLLQYGEDFEIPKPDLAIYLDVDPEIAFKRKEKEEGHDEGLDMFEKSLDKQKKLRGIFKDMVKDSTYCKWVEIDGNGNPQEVTNAIIQALVDQKIISNS